MNLLTQVKPQCTAYSLAMLFNVTPEHVFNSLGHDGMEVIWPGIEPPHQYVGVNPQECTEYAFQNHGTPLLYVAKFPASQPPIQGCPPCAIWSDEECVRRFQFYLDCYDALLMTRNHAVAWCHEEGKVYDPQGKVAGIEDYTIIHGLFAIKSS